MQSNIENRKQEIAASLRLGTEPSWTKEERIMVEDALEGLNQIADEEILENAVSAINKNLQAQINKRKKNISPGRRPFDSKHLWVYTIIVLMLVLLAWLVISKI